MPKQSLWLVANRLKLNHWLVWYHRWAGVVLCLLFAIWFASGAVLHFIGFPALPDSERVVSSAPIDLTKLRAAPSVAIARLPATDDLRLVSVAGRPVYLASAGGLVRAVAGDTGQTLERFSAATARDVAAQFGHAGAIRVDGPFDYDQWIVHQRFDPYRPFYRVRLNDARSTDLYVSATTGEVLQRTRRGERAWNWCGAVVHWIYFTELRKSWSAWNQVVWWVSLAALLTSLVGVWLGILRFAATRASGRTAWSPFRGWKRWHHIVGLFASAVVVAWMFSGWLSMDHGRLFSGPAPGKGHLAAMRGMPMTAIARTATLETLRAVGPATEVGLQAIASRPFLTIDGGVTPSVRRLIWLDSGRQPDARLLSEDILLTGVRAAWPQATARVVNAGGIDATYRLAESVAPDALAVQLEGVNTTVLYVDRFTGRPLAVMDPNRRTYAWVYYALHTLNFPALIAHPAARTAIIMVLLIAGLAFSVTGIVLGVLAISPRAAAVNR